MTDTPDTPAAPPAGAQTLPAAAPVKLVQRVLSQYVRDMSFENVLAQKGLTGDLAPEIAVKVNLDARKRGGDNQYEVITKLGITSKTKSGGEVLFAMDLEYAGVFLIEGLPDEQLHPYLLIECPRITFPYVRRIVSDVTRDGGFPPLNLEMIDFLSLYRQDLARRLQAQGAATPKLDS